MSRRNAPFAAARPRGRAELSVLQRPIAVMPQRIGRQCGAGGGGRGRRPPPQDQRGDVGRDLQDEAVTRAGQADLHRFLHSPEGANEGERDVLLALRAVVAVERRQALRRLAHHEVADGGLPGPARPGRERRDVVNLPQVNADVRSVLTVFAHGGARVGADEPVFGVVHGDHDLAGARRPQRASFDEPAAGAVHGGLPLHIVEREADLIPLAALHLPASRHVHAAGGPRGGILAAARRQHGHQQQRRQPRSARHGSLPGLRLWIAPPRCGSRAAPGDPLACGPFRL